VGDKKINKVLTTRKATFAASTQLALKFEPVAEVSNYTVYALCESYIDYDQA
jgi:hypothetical protein